MTEKKAGESSLTLVQQMTQQDANLAGNVHGGVIMKMIDTAAGIVAARHSSGYTVTASIDRLDFHNPVYVGDLLRIAASVNNTGKTSMEIGVRVEAENFISGLVRHTASAYLTFVAMDSQGNKRQVSGVIPESEEQKRRYREAAERKKFRLAVKTSEKSCT